MLLFEYNLRQWKTHRWNFSHALLSYRNHQLINYGKYIYICTECYRKWI